MDDEACYRIKRIRFPPWNSNALQIPILLQDVNGPCPLLAIMNVLLLRQAITLPAGAGEVTQSRAVQMLAEHLLDTNFSRSEGGSSEEFRANLQHNLSDAVALLPKLCSGLDVNVRFDGVRSIEFTGETAVFDLLGIDLVHGWLVDPQDTPTAAAIGSRSYNDVVLQIVAALGRDATPASISRRSTAASLGGGGSFSARGSSALIGSTTSGPSAITTTATTTACPPEKGKIDAATLSAALQSTLRVTIPKEPPSGLDVRSRSTVESCTSLDSVTSVINKMLGETVKEAFKTPNASANARSRTQLPSISGGIEGEKEETGEEGVKKDASEEQEAVLLEEIQKEKNENEENLAGGGVSAAAAAEEGSVEKNEEVLQTPSSEKHESEIPTPAPVEPETETTTPQALPPLGTSTSTATTPATTKDGGAVGEAAIREALLSQEFLENNPSQLTVYGLSSLMENMGDQQLAVFFRNNHFNVLLKSGVGLFILITDQGYLYEPEIVWEHLNNVDGDTELLGWDLKPFKQHADASSGAGAGAAGAAHLQSDSSNVIINNNTEGGSGVNIGPGHVEDADYALAVQLQQEEEARVRVEEERRRASSAAAAAAGRQGGGGGGGAGGGGGRPPAPPGRVYNARPQQQQQQQQQQPRQQEEKKKRKKSSGTDCSIM